MINLKELRLKKGLTQQQLSEKIKISVKTISDIENNKRIPNDLNKNKIMNFFKISKNELFSK